VLYTDGVVEPTDEHEQEFGTHRLETAVRSVARRPAAEALRAVIDATRAFAGRDRYDDDFTLVVVKRAAAAG
jgi:serine phosphatase RsbU (regulator of sigma subunit)